MKTDRGIATSDLAQGRPTKGPQRDGAQLSQLAELQRAAGNQAVTALLQAQSGQVVQREVMEYVKDGYKHAKDLVKTKKEGQEDTGEDWEHHSEEAALHTRETFDLAALVLKKVAKSVGTADPAGAKETLEYAEGFEKASELVKTGGEVFEKGVQVVKITQAATELKAAIDEVNNHDILSDPQGSARAFDQLFTATGEFADRISPKGPWKGYFELLKHFKDNGGFFQNVSAQYRGEVGPEADALRREGIDPAKENRWRTEPPAKSAEKISLGKLHDDVTAKIERLKATTGLADLDWGRDDFDERYQKFAEAWQAYDRVSLVGKVRQTETARTLKAELVKATDFLIERLQGLQRETTGTDVSFQPDIEALTRVKQ